MAGRPESPLDPGTGPVAQFAAELRKLRAEAGSPTYRVMAQRAGQGTSTLSQAAGGERLPTLPVVLAYVRACGGDPEEWEERWRQAAAEAAAKPRTADEDAEPPYRGLARFEPGDADLFFGRDELTDRLVELTRSRRFTAVFGPSGSGKSSLLRAGLIPRLRTPDQATPQPAALRVLTPGEHPLRTHEQRLAPKDGDGDTWLIVDQFEELYTLCHDPAERDQFIDRLLTATDPGCRLRVVIAVRADFLGRCAQHPRLTAALQEVTVLAGPMSRDELREAIVKPAQTAGLIVERTLTTRIVEDVEGEPGALPLMSHALLETWRRRKGRALTAEAYDAAGGLSGAIARTAENVYTHLTPSQADFARRILLRLITPGEGTPDTRRPAPRTELDFGDPSDTATVLERLARARLLTLEHDTVNLAHEALIAAWPRLQAWINEARDRLRLHRQLTEAARTWDGLNQDPGALYRGTMLAAAEEAFADPAWRRALNTAEAKFLTASLDAQAGERRATARTTRRLRTLVAALSALLLVALAAAGVALKQRAAANAERTTAVARQIAAEADQLRGTDVPAQTEDVALAALLDVTSYRMRDSARTYTSLVQAANSALFKDVPEQDRAPAGPGAMSEGSPRLAQDAHRRTLAAVGDDGNVRLWDTTDFTHPRRVGRTLPGSDVAMTPDGHVLAIGIRLGVQLWNIADPADPTPLGSIPTSGDTNRMELAFGNDGHWLAVGTTSTALWNVTDPRKPERLAASLPGDMVAFSPSRKIMATADSGNGTVRLWGTSHRARPAALGLLRTHSDKEIILVFSPDGRYLATNGSEADKVPLWDVSRPDQPTSSDIVLGTSDGTEAGAASYSPDGRVVAVSGGNGIQLWNIDAGLSAPLGRALGQRSTTGITTVFAPDGRTLIAAGGALRIWSLPPGELLRCATSSTTGFSPDGRIMATACTDGEPMRLWDVADPGVPRLLPGTLAPGTAAEFAPHRHLLAVTASDGGVRLYDVTDPARPHTLGHLTAGRDDAVVLSAFSPDGRELITYEEMSDRSQPSGPGIGDGDGRIPSEVRFPDNGVRIRTWDLGDPRHPRETGRAVVLEKNAGAGPLARASDGHELAIVDDDRRILLWDTSSPRHPRRRGRSFVGDVPAFAPHGDTMAIGSANGTVSLWNTADPARPTKLGTPLDAGASVTGLAFDRNGQRLAVGTVDGLIKLYDTTDPAHAKAVGDPIVRHTAEIDNLVFAPGGQSLASGAQDGTRLWALDAEQNIHRICAVTGHALTRDQWQRHVGALPYQNPCP